MKVMKFGGTSVGTPERMKSVAKMVSQSGNQVFVVLSAMSGTTNSLVEISNYLYKKNSDGANDVINNLEKKYMQHVEELYSTDEMKQRTREFLVSEFNYLRSFTKDLFTSFEEKNIVAQGEIISTNMMTNYLLEKDVKVVLLSAFDFMRTDKNAEPDSHYIKEKLGAVMKENEGYQVYITQGFICRNAYGEVDNLLRGGSDFTASLIGVLSRQRKSRYGPTLTACIITTRASWRIRRPSVSSTSRRQPSWLTLERRFFTRHAYSQPSLQASPYV